MKFLYFFILTAALFSTSLFGQADFNKLADFNGAPLDDITSTNGGVFFAVSGQGLFKSGNNGSEWEKIENEFIKPAPKNTYSLAANSFSGTERVYVLSPTGIIKSADVGQSWQEVTLPDISGEFYIEAFYAAPGGDIYLSIVENDFSTIYMSENAGESFDIIAENQLFVNDFILAGNKTLISTGLAFYSWDKNAKELEELLPPFTEAYALENHYGLIIASTPEIYMSSDNGLTWDEMNFGLEGIGAEIKIIPAGDSLLLAANKDNSSDIYQWDSEINSWVLILESELFTASSFAFVNNTILGATGAGAVKSADYGETWALANNGLSGLVVTTANFSGDDYIFAALPEKYLLRQDKNSGEMKMMPLVISEDLPFSDIEFGGGNILVTTAQGVFFSTDNGEAWDSTDFIGNEGRFSLALFDGGRFYFTQNSNLYASEDFGQTAEVIINFPNNARNPSPYKDGGILVSAFGTCYLVDSEFKYSELPVGGSLFDHILYNDKAQSWAALEVISNKEYNIHLSKDGESWAKINYISELSNTQFSVINGMAILDNGDVIMSSLEGILRAPYEGDEIVSEAEFDGMATFGMKRNPEGKIIFTAENGSLYEVIPGAVSVGAAENDAKIIIAPNPAAAYVEFKGVDAGADIRVYNTSGEIFYSGQLEAGRRIDVSAWPSGAYAFSLKEEPGVVGKFMISR